MTDTTDAVMNGKQCAECLTTFSRAHGYPVLCNDCFKHAPKDTPYSRATFRELSR